MYSTLLTIKRRIHTYCTHYGNDEEHGIVEVPQERLKILHMTTVVGCKHRPPAILGQFLHDVRLGTGGVHCIVGS
jgi:hypothetical protein